MKLLLQLDDGTVIGKWQVQMITHVHYDDWEATARAHIQHFLDERDPTSYGGLEPVPRSQWGGLPELPKT